MNFVNLIFYDIFSTKFSHPQCIAYFTGVKFYLQEKGIKSCPAGSELTDTNKCKEACRSLNISLSNSFKDGKQCLKGGNGVCKQSGSVGSKASLVCQKIGTIICL